jgi:acetyl esterase/lipase
MKSITCQVACVSFMFALASATLAADPEVLRIWPGDAPGETGEIGPETSTPGEGDRPVTRVTNVTQPTMTVFRPPAEKANGCAVVICPGGGYHILAWDLEGTEVAAWLNSLGVTAVLLKYRVPRRSKEAPHELPLQDAQRALRLTRQNAQKWGVDPQRIGILGFSAGGNLTVMAGTHWDRSTYEKVDDADALSCRPDFMIPIYPAYLIDKEDDMRLNPLVRITKQTPPAFIVITHDDKDRAPHAALFYVAMQRAGIPCELHIFSRGGHGYGLRPSDLPVSRWPQLCEQWLRTSGFLKPRK